MSVLVKVDWVGNFHSFVGATSTSTLPETIWTWFRGCIPYIESIPAQFEGMWFHIHSFKDVNLINIKFENVMMADREQDVEIIGENRRKCLIISLK
jgi:hypothetical protein